MFLSEAVRVGVAPQPRIRSKAVRRCRPLASLYRDSAATNTATESESSGLVGAMAAAVPANVGVAVGGLGPDAALAALGAAAVVAVSVALPLDDGSVTCFESAAVAGPAVDVSVLLLGEALDSLDEALESLDGVSELLAAPVLLELSAAAFAESVDAGALEALVPLVAALLLLFAVGVVESPPAVSAEAGDAAVAVEFEDASVPLGAIADAEPLEESEAGVLMSALFDAAEAMVPGDSGLAVLAVGVSVVTGVIAKPLSVMVVPSMAVVAEVEVIGAITKGTSEVLVMDEAVEGEVDSDEEETKSRDVEGEEVIPEAVDDADPVNDVATTCCTETTADVVTAVVDDEEAITDGEVVVIALVVA